MARNLSAVVGDDKTEAYSALVSHRGKVVFQEEYEFEALAALAADMAKFIVKVIPSVRDCHS